MLSLFEGVNELITDSFIPTRPFLLAGCMLCFGQSVFFRFNHPEEALRMKSMLPGGSQGSSTTRTHPTGRRPCFNNTQHLLTDCNVLLHRLCWYSYMRAVSRNNWSGTLVCRKVVQFVYLFRENALGLWIFSHCQVLTTLLYK